MTRILLINPNSNAATTAMMVEIAAAAAGNRARITGATARHGPAMLTTPADLAAAAVEVIAIGRSQAAPYSAILVAAFGDPGAADLAQIVAIPVLGLAEASMRAGLESQVRKAADAAVRGKSTGERFAGTARDMQGIVDNGYVIIGSADEVAEQLREVATNLNVGHLMLLLQYGNMNKELARYNTRMFAEHVKPKLKDMFSEWEDKWWPNPMASREQAAPAPLAPRMSAE